MGGLGGQGWGNMPNLQSYLTMGSLEIFKQLQIDMGYDMEFRLSGTLSGIHTEEQYNFLEDRVRALRADGYDGELLNPREARAIEPEVSLELAGYLYSPGRGQADRGVGRGASGIGAVAVVNPGLQRCELLFTLQCTTKLCGVAPATGRWGDSVCMTSLSSVPDPRAAC